MTTYKQTLINNINNLRSSLSRGPGMPGPWITGANWYEMVHGQIEGAFEQLNLVEEIERALADTQRINPTHFESIMTERKFGSKWGEAPKFDQFISWERVEGDLPFCKYYRAMIAGAHANATVGIIKGSELPKDAIVTVMAGGHTDPKNPEGKFLVVNMGKDELPAYWAHVIVGPAEDANGKPVEGQTMVWTAYPGPMTKNIDFEWIASKSVGEVIDHAEINKDWAIKLV